MIEEEQKNILIIGKKRSGKSCLGFKFAEFLGKNNRQIYTYRHPKPDKLRSLPFSIKNINNMKQLTNLKNAVVIVDEAHKHFSIWDKAVNTQLRDILSISAQNNICFVLITHNSYFLNRSLFSFIDVKIIKEVNEGHWDLERPFMKKLYQNIAVSGRENFFIDSDEYRGKERFEKPEWFTEDISFSYRNEEEKDFFGKMREIDENPETRVKKPSEKAE